MKGFLNLVACGIAVIVFVDGKGDFLENGRFFHLNNILVHVMNSTPITHCLIYLWIVYLNGWLVARSRGRSLDRSVDYRMFIYI